MYISVIIANPLQYVPLQTVGLKSCYVNKIELTQLHAKYGSLGELRKQFALKTAGKNQGKPIPLQIIGIAELAPISVKVTIIMHDGCVFCI